jgi:hypothetical protein
LCKCEEETSNSQGWKCGLNELFQVSDMVQGARIRRWEECLSCFLFSFELYWAPTKHLVFWYNVKIQRFKSCLVGMFWLGGGQEFWLHLLNCVAKDYVFSILFPYVY